jgi:hypothetical protein
MNRHRHERIEAMNLTLYCYLAQAVTPPDLKEVANAAKWKPFMSRETALMLGVIGAISLAFFIWAFFIRKRRSTDPHRRVIEPGATAEDGAPARENRGRHGGHRHRRHHRRSSQKLHRNPTLQETGGLPPLRPEDQPPVV